MYNAGFRCGRISLCLSLSQYILLYYSVLGAVDTVMLLTLTYTHTNIMHHDVHQKRFGSMRIYILI
jgi:hypothetical protein